MGAACFPAAVADPFDTFVEEAMATFGRWLQGFRSTFEQSEPPTLQELSDLMTNRRGELLGGCMKAAIEQLYAPWLTATTYSCRLCGRALRRKRIDAKGLSTMQGTFELGRPYFYCAPCAWSCHPLDIALGLSRSEHQYDIQDNIVRLAADLPYKLSAKHFRRLTGIEVGAHFAHSTVNAVTQLARLEDVIPTTESLQTRIKDASSPDEEPPVLVVAIDGAHTPIRPAGGRRDKRGKGEWKETKGVRLYLVSDDDRVEHLISWHRNGDKKAFEHDLKRIVRRLPEHDLQVAAIADGAPWIWDLMQRYFPGARQVLDYYHCSEHIHELANEHFDDADLAAQWVEATLARLSAGRVGAVIGGLKRMRPSSDAVADTIRKLIGYLHANKERVAYDSCSQQHIPKGSGGIESANKYVHHTRLKRSGAWWLKPNANHMLQLRCSILNQTFRQLFDRHVAFELKLLNI